MSRALYKFNLNEVIERAKNKKIEVEDYWNFESLLMNECDTKKIANSNGKYLKQFSKDLGVDFNYSYLKLTKDILEYGKKENLLFAEDDFISFERHDMDDKLSVSILSEKNSLIELSSYMECKGQKNFNVVALKHDITEQIEDKEGKYETSKVHITKYIDGNFEFQIGRKTVEFGAIDYLQEGSIESMAKTLVYIADELSILPDEEVKMYIEDLSKIFIKEEICEIE